MDFNHLSRQIADYGFPMVLSWYLLLRMESKLDKLTAAIANLHQSILSKQIQN